MSEPAGGPATGLTAEEVFSSFFTDEFRADPYPYYARLRELGPVHPCPLGGLAVVTWDPCTTLARHPAISSSRAAIMLELVLSSRGTVGPFARLLKTMMVFRDPPDHTRLRALVSKAFTPKAVEGVRPVVEGIVDRLLDAAVEGETCDWMAAVARPLPALVMCELLGIPASDQEMFQRWSADMITMIDVAAPPEALAVADASGEQFFAYFQALIAERTAGQGDDLLSSLIAAEEAGDSLNEDELIATAMLLLIAGYETTMNLLGNGALLLLRHPDTRRRLAADPGLLRAGVEEMLRFDAPVQLTLRTIEADVEIDGVPIPAGEQLILFMGSANRDARRFAEPDRFAVDRADSGHLSFLSGVHFCLGAPLARLEAQVAFGRWLSRAPDPELATDQLRWRPNFTMRGLVELPVSLGVAARG